MKFAATLTLFVGFLISGSATFGQPPETAEPRLLTSPKVKVPKEAKESSLGGTVSVRVSLDEAGTVLSIEDVAGPGIVCNSVDRPDVVAIRNAARGFALRSKFSPAIRDGQAIASTLWVKFDFPGGTGTSDFNLDDSGKGKRYFSAANAPPPDYQGPVNTGDPPRTLSGGALNGKAAELPRPAYPPAAPAVKAAGSVPVRVLIDELGNIFMAQAVDGHPLLRPSAVRAACSAKFTQTLLSGKPVKVSGIITYNFVP